MSQVWNNDGIVSNNNWEGACHRSHHTSNVYEKHTFLEFKLNKILPR